MSAETLLVTYGPLSIPISTAAVLAFFQYAHRRWDKKIEELAKAREERQDLRFKFLEVKLQDAMDAVRANTDNQIRLSKVFTDVDKAVAILTSHVSAIRSDQDRVQALDPRVARLETKFESLIEAIKNLRRNGRDE